MTPHRNAWRQDWIAKLQQDEFSGPNCFAEGAVQFSIWILHRSYQIEFGQSSGSLRPQANDFQRRTLYHSELKEMEGKSWRRGAECEARARAVPKSARRGCWVRLKQIQETVRPWPTRMCWQRLPKRRAFTITRPKASQNGVLMVRDGRHPVIEQNLTESGLCQNDVTLTPMCRSL